MHEYIAELDGPQSYRTVTGKMILCKGGGGGGKGGVGAVLGIVASIAMPIMAPNIAAAMGVSNTVATAIAGAGMGAVGAAVTGGDPLKGMIMGGIGGAAGSMFQEAGGFSGIFGNGAGVSTLDAPTIGGTAAPSWTGLNPVEAAPTSSFSSAISDAMSTPSSTTFGAMDGSAGGFTDTLYGPGNTTNSGFTSPSQAMTPTGSPVATGSFTGNFTPSAGLNTSNAAGGAPASNQSFVQRLTSPDNLAKGVTQLGLQTGASYLMGVPQALEQQQKTAEQQLALEREAYEFNKGQVGKKNVVGDQLVQDANSYNPNDFGAKAAATAQITDANSWDTYKKSLEARGADQREISAEQARFKLGSGLNQSTAYGQGWTSGLNAQTGTKTSGASLYQNISGPSNMYGTASGQANNATKAAGDLARTINQDFGISPNAQTAADQSKVKDPYATT